MKYYLASWSGLLKKGYTDEKVNHILKDAANMWGKGTEVKQDDGSYILINEGIKNRIYFEDGKIWRSDENVENEEEGVKP